jgi:hypothetical protein
MMFVTSWLVAATVAVTLPGASPTQEFDRGRTAFLRGEYERAVTLLYPLLYPELRLETENEALQAHRMLGVAYLFVNKPAEARIEFRKLLELSPDFQFDPLLDPPRVVEFFNGIVREQREQLGDIEARLKKLEEQRNRHVGEILVRRVERRSYAVSFIPFGAGQFQNQQRTKGWIFFGVEAGLAAISVGAFVTNFATYGTGPHRDCRVELMYEEGKPACPRESIDYTKENASRDLTRVQVASGLAFAGVAIWGVVDAVRNFRAEVPLGDTYVPVNTLPAPTIPPSAWRLTPLLGPVAQGGALTFTF